MMFEEKGVEGSLENGLPFSIKGNTMKKKPVVNWNKTVVHVSPSLKMTYYLRQLYKKTWVGQNYFDVSSVVTRLDISRATVKKYIAILLDDGCIEAFTLMPGVTRYRVTDKGNKKCEDIINLHKKLIEEYDVMDAVYREPGEIIGHWL